MGKITGGRIGALEQDNLIAKLYPPKDTFLVELKTAGAYKRGTVLSMERDGTYEMLGKGTGKASVVLEEDTEAGETTAVAYRSGHFNRQALIVKEGYTMTAADENDLRLAGIHLSDMLPTAGEEAEGAEDDAGSEDEKTYTETELNAMTVEQIKTLAAGKGYTITKTVKAEIITEFLAAQTAAGTDQNV